MALLRPDGKLHARCDILIHDAKAPLRHVLLKVDADNGSVGITKKGDYVDTGVNREVYNLTQATTALLTAKVQKDDIVIISAPELINDESTKAVNQFKNFYSEKEDVVRAYPLSIVRKFKVSEEAIDKADASTDLTIGQFVVLQNGSFKMKASATAVDGGTVGKIVRIDQEGKLTYIASNGKADGLTYKTYVIEVL